MPSRPALAGRAAEFGPLGEFLEGILPLYSEASGYEDLDTAGKLIALEGIIPALLSRHPLLPAAVSLLQLPFPLQLPNPHVIVHHLLRAAIPLDLIPFQRRRATRAAYRSLFLGSRGGSPTRLLRRFPLKNNAAAGTKNSVELRALGVSIVNDFGVQSLSPLLGLPSGSLTEDQACSALLLGVVLNSAGAPLPFYTATALVAFPDRAKGLSNALKALGANSDPLGACLTEAQVLRGRGVGTPDLNEEVRYRCDSDAVKAKVVNVDPEDLREHIRAIITSEMPQPPNLDDRDSWWSRRWLWCVNGTENSLSDRALKLDSAKWKRTHARAYRKMAAEGVEADPTQDWDGTTLVSVSPKLEHGKTRVIFACDTRSYFAFARLLDPVQRAWRNRRVLLDPGAGGMLGVSRRIRGMRSRGGVNLMLDYDDFNSHHSTGVMKVVFEELGSVMRCPDSMLRPLLDSFDRTYISHRGRLSRVLGTLMSGHRGTTFVNSVLNAAYIRYAVGGPTYDSMDSLHTGDDVYVCANTLKDCATVLSRCAAIGCRMNPSKQSVGYTTAEFLRCTITDRCSRGYACRAIASITCGSWVSPTPLSPTESLRNLIVTTRSLINRSGGEDVVAHIASAAKCRRVVSHLGSSILPDVLRGVIALGDGPIFGGTGRYRSLEIQEKPVENRISDIISELPSFASRAYLSRHVSPIERTAMDLASIDPLPILKSQSYTKGLLTGEELGSSVYKLVLSEFRFARGQADVNDLVSTKPVEGVLSRYPLIRFFENRLSTQNLRALVALAGGDAAARNIREAAFGASHKVHRFVGALPYSDAAHFSGRSLCQNIYVRTPVYM